MNIMEINFTNHFYAGRIYQYYLDNKETLSKGLIKELGFLVPKKEGIEIAKLKSMIKVLVEKDGVIVKCSTLPKKNGWRFSFNIVS